MKKTYKIEVDCANCANLMEEAANKVEGVAKATVNFMALKLIVEFADGADPTLVQAMMENQISQQQEEITNGAKVFESAGGYSPTLGIIGAVMGLIQVMQNLSDPSALGAGIAVAFVATI